MSFRKARRHWRQRFDPTMRMVFRRPTTIGVDRYSVGEAVPPEISTRLLHKWWHANKIELANFVPPKKVRIDTRGREGQIVEAIAGLDQESETDFTSTGLPKTKVLEEILGYEISAKERTEAWKAFRETNGDR